AGAADRALRSEGAALPRPPGANGTCDVAFCYCGVRLRRLTCGAQPTGAGQWVPADAAARRLKRDCARAGVPGCSKCLRALSTVRSNVAMPATSPVKITILIVNYCFCRQHLSMDSLVSSQLAILICEICKCTQRQC
uniref:SPARK domain-containing protein n=1 Tax=Aegilops tauschii subsp. strangulata TaxID=200361 RepID=A0A453PDJ6_AEGTS